MHPRFKLDWLDESNTDEKSLKEAITIKLQNQMTLLVPGSMSMETRISPDDPKDFYSSLKKNLQQLWQIQSKLNYQGSLKKKIPKTCKC
jgi:hypothetical protein